MENISGKFIVLLLLIALMFNAPSKADSITYSQKSEIHEESREENTIIFVIIIIIIVILVISIFIEPIDKQ